MTDLPYLVRRSLRDVLARERMQHVPFPMKLDGDEEHLRETMAWLLRAVEHGEGGVAGHYSLLHGRWLPPFPETTGYVVPTLFDYAALSGEPRYADAAVRLTEWLREVQHAGGDDDGGCMQGLYDRRRGKTRPIIFNTGQNVFGFLRAYAETGEERFMDSARRAGDFLARKVDARGVWNAALHHHIPHTYNARSAWALLELHEATGEARYAEVARANLDWAVAQQAENGWFRNAHFKPGELPNTHGLAYTTRGLLESYRLTREPAYLAAAQRTADKVLRLFEIRKHLYVFWDEGWQNHGKYFPRMRGRHVCVTGNVQFALVWMRLFELTGDAPYASSAFKMVDFVKTLQDLKSRHEGVRGGVPGAFPLFGSYASLKFPNWAAKFFAEALMLKRRLMEDERLVRPAPQQAEVAR